MASMINAQAGLPSPNPTTPYWMNVLHPLAEVQSVKLPEVADVVIIGSGITGASIAKNILDNDANIRVSVLEARSLCSGATARNGGHLVTPGAILYSSLKQESGQEQAKQFVDFTLMNLDAVWAAAQQYAPEVSEIRNVTRIHSFKEESTLNAAKASIAEYERDYPQDSGRYTYIDAETARRERGINVAGAVLFPAKAIWPYRLIMKVWETLLAQYSSRFTIDAKTPATSVSQNPETNSTYKYRVETPRGAIRAAKVVYATNAYTGYLLPELRGIISPFRDGMTVQDLNHEVPNRGNNTSWNMNYSEQGSSHLDYLQQNGISGYFFFGGQDGPAGEANTFDDSQTSPTTTQHLRAELPKFFSQKNPERNRLISEWTGIQGMTTDGAAMLGPLPKSVTKRDGDGEWIAAGFNGGGMCQCWLAGVAIGGMVRGEKTPAWFPEKLRLTESRLNQGLRARPSGGRA